MHMFRAVLAAVLLLLSASMAWADSPLTSTDFYQAYMHIPQVAQAHQLGQLDQGLCDYLHDPANPIDAKAAVINALEPAIIGQGLDGTLTPNRSATLRGYLAQRYGGAPDNLPYDAISPAELMCLGYLVVMENDYLVDSSLALHQGIDLITRAQNNSGGSRTIDVVKSLCLAQSLFRESWCGVWVVVSEAVKRQGVVEDLDPNALAIILDYIGLYQPDCATVMEPVDAGFYGAGGYTGGDASQGGGFESGNPKY
ncbi:MAG: hypothetical protein D6E12_10680 [Desulfovibrio sp.]|nr:MAG: hypothetical protein D6E12_10680 [Desulfovibrio sp.]